MFGAGDGTRTRKGLAFVQFTPNLIPNQVRLPVSPLRPQKGAAKAAYRQPEAAEVLFT